MYTYIWIFQKDALSSQVGGASSFVLSWLSKPRHFDASAGFLSKRSVRRSGQ